MTEFEKDNKPKVNLEMLRSWFPDVISAIQPHQQNWVITSVAMFDPSTNARGSGRTFAGVAGALIVAATHPNQTVYYVDHYPIRPASRPATAASTSWLMMEIHKVIGLFPEYFAKGFQVKKEDHCIAIRWSAR